MNTRYYNSNFLRNAFKIIIVKRILLKLNDQNFFTLQKLLFLAFSILGFVIGISSTFFYSSIALADPVPTWGPKWTKNDELMLPENYHAWIFLGAPLTPNALNQGKAGFPEYHNVYIQPQAYQAYRETGQFPDGTVLLKELQLTLQGTNPDGSRIEPSGRGFFPGNYNGIDISVKDTKRFKDTHGWGFYNFGHHAPPYERTAKIQGKESCAGCHMAHANNMVFTKFYSAILDSK